MQRATILLLLLLLGAPAFADEKKPGPKAPPEPLTTEQAAEAVVAAVKAKDQAALVSLAARGDPDPWLVADELRAQGRGEAAKAYADAAPARDKAALRAYAAKARGPLDAKRRGAVDTLNTALGRGDWGGALAVAEGLADPNAGVAGIRLAFGRGLALRELGRPADAVAWFRRAGEGAADLGWLSRASTSFHRAGRQAYASSDWASTHLLWRRAHMLAAKSGDSELEAMTLSNVGVILMDLGRYAESRRAIEGALALRRRFAGPRELAQNLVNAAAVYQRMGHYAAALAALEEAHTLAKRVADAALHGSILQGLGSMKILVRQPREALAYFEAALALAQTRPQEADALASALESVAAGLALVRRFEEAITHYERARTIRRKRADTRAEARVLTHLGATYVRTDQDAEAAAAFAEALAIQQRIRDRVGAMSTLWRLGTLHGSKNRFAEARVALNGAQAILDDVPNADLQMRVYWAQAGVHYGLREWRACLDRCRQAEHIASGLSARLGDQEASGAADNWVGIYDTALRAAVRLPMEERTAELWHFLESGRANALREALQARGALHDKLIPETLREDAARARSDHARAIAALRTSRSRNDLQGMRTARKRLHEARMHQQAVVARIQRLAKAGAAIAYPKPEALAAVQQRLAPEEALVLYGFTERDAVALVVTKEAARSVTLIGTERIRAACEALLAGDDLVIAPAAIAPLRTMVIDPLALPPSVKRVLISPTRILGYVPFALLLPQHELAFVPSGTTHGHLYAERDLRGVGILGLGDPSYGIGKPSPRQTTLRGALAGRLPPLPGTRKEVEALADVKLLGKSATEAGFRAAVSKRARWRAVHLACHGLVDSERPLFSALVLTPDAEDDGLLTCADLFSLRVPADLVTLSACETAKGRIYRTEGILGLTRALMFAGAPRVICSLWRVDDEATRALMIRFYELWNPRAKPGDPELVEGSARKGLGAAAALKAAQAFVRGHDQWKHPHYWAAWVLWGLP